MGHGQRQRALRQALVFDLESHVITYRLLPGGIVYDVVQVRGWMGQQQRQWQKYSSS